jgi:hypothetical protein
MPVLKSAFGSVVEDVIAKSMSSVLNKERQNEIKKIGKAWDFYYGYQEQYIKRYRGETKEDYIDKDKPTFNYTKAIVDEYIKGVFGEPVTITFNDDPHQKIWDGIETPMSFYKVVPFMTKVQRIAEISNTCLVMIRYNQAEGRTYFEDIRGEFVYFLPKTGSPKEIGTIIISYLFDTGDPDPQRRILRRVEAWDEEKWEVWLYSQGMNEAKLVDSGGNPYGFIPAEKFCPEEDDNTFYGITNMYDVVKVNEIYNNLWTALVRICIMQSFSILVVKSEGEIKLTVAPTRFLKIENTEEGSASYITPNPKINEVEAVLMDVKSELQNMSHVPSEVMSSSKGITPESGYALRIKRVPIEQEWDKRRMSYGPSVRDFCKKVVAVDTINRNGTVDVGSIGVEVQFTDTTPPLAPQEQILTDEQELRYNLITPVDLMMRKDPTLTREEAKTRIEKNKQENDDLGLVAFGEDNQTEFERLKVRMGRKKAAIEKPATPPEVEKP